MRFPYSWEVSVMHMVRRVGYKFPAMVLAVAALWIAIWVDANAQDPAVNRQILKQEGYILPPKIILDAVMGAEGYSQLHQPES